MRKYSPIARSIHPDMWLILVIHMPDFGILAKRPAKVPRIIRNVPIPRAKIKNRLKIGRAHV
jgi:hypothetical protein